LGLSSPSFFHDPFQQEKRDGNTLTISITTQLKSWKQQLPISTAMRLIGAVSPEISVIVQKGDNAQQQILNYLKETTLVGVLPVPHPILIRRFQQNQATIVWLHRYLWSVVIVRNRAPPLFGGQFVRLFDNISH